MGRGKKERENDKSGVEVKLTGDEARKVLKEDNGKSETNASFMRKLNSLLKDPVNKVVVTRLFPRVVEGPDGSAVPITFDVFNASCPVSLDDIRNEVFETHGGWKYRVAVINQDDEILGATVIENGLTREPKIRFGQESVGPLEKEVPPDKPEALEAMKQSLNRQFETLQTQQEIEQMQDTIRNIRDGKKPKAKTETEDPKLTALQAEIERLKQEREQDKYAQLIKAVQDSADKKIEALERTIQTQAQKGGLTEVITVVTPILERLLGNKSSDKTELVINTLKESTQAQIETIKDVLLRKGEEGTKSSAQEMLEIYQLMKKVASGEEINLEPKSTFDRIVEMVPQALEKISNLMKERANMDKTEADAAVKKAFQDAADETAKKLEQEGKVIAPEPLPQPAPQPETAATQKTTTPAQSPPIAPKTPRQNRALVIEEVLKAIVAELDIQPAEANWPEIALRAFPRSLNEAILKAQDPVQLYQAINAEAPGSASLEALKSKVITDTAAQQWFRQSVEDYKEMLTGDGEKAPEGT